MVKKVAIVGSGAGRSIAAAVTKIMAAGHTVEILPVDGEIRGHQGRIIDMDEFHGPELNRKERRAEAAMLRRRR